MYYLGIDVSKATLDVSDPSGDRRLSSANSRPGIRKVIKWAQGKYASNKVIQFVIEPTSTYHHVLLDELSNSDIAFTVINPARTKAYSNSLGRRAKTDRVDAQLLASLGQTQQTAPSHQPERFQEQIKSLRRHRESIEQLILSVRNRIEATTRSPWADSEVVRSLRSTVRHLENQVAAADQRLEKLISEMPPAWQCSTSRAWVAFAGVCPQPFQSGTSSYSRLSRMGSRRVRAGMYMAAVASMKSNPAIAELVARLKKRGKGGKLIVMAAMNKLIRICYGVIKTRKPFNPTLNIAPKTA